jgi:lambda family phage portal protein
MNIFKRAMAGLKYTFTPKAYHDSYSGGQGYRSDGSKFHNGITGSGQHITLDHSTVLTNARRAAWDSPTAKAMIDRRADTVADVGLKLECMPDTKILGISEDAAEEWAENTESRWNVYASSKKQNRAERMTFNASQALYQKDDERDGENFIRLYYSKDRDLISPVQFQFIDPNQIRGHAETNTYAPMGGDDGIERDSRDREKSYKIWYLDQNGNYKQETVQRVGSRSKRTFMLHGFVSDLPGQTRGVSKFAPILQEFQQVTSFKLAQIEKAINQSQTVFLTKNNIQDPSNPLEDMPKGKSTFGAPPSGTEEILADPTAAEIEFCTAPQAAISRTPGATVLGNLIQGDDVQAVPQTAPSIGYSEFVLSFVGDLAAARGMPMEVLLMKFQNNYSASRAALVLFWRVAIIRRQEMIDDYIQPVYEMWLSEEIAAGRIKAPGWNDPRKKAAWLNCEWYGSPMPNINPLQEAKANKENIEIMATNIDRAARETNGSNGKANLQKNKKVFGIWPLAPWSKNAQTQGGQDG